jgi:hypothetical protein
VTPAEEVLADSVLITIMSLSTCSARRAVLVMHGRQS